MHMSFFGALFKGLSALVVSVLALGLFSSAAVPTASFTMSPPNPVMGQPVQFADTSTGSPTSWSWNFGDGQSSTLQNPAHAFAGPGSFNVTVTAFNASGSTQQTQPVIVSPIDTLRLNNKGNNAFTVKLIATNQHNGNVQGAGQAIPQNDLFGYFSLPSLTGSPDNPEVFVKILDGRGINGQFWVFYGHLTDLIYDITVTEVATGFVKTYHKDPGNSPGGFDTSGFDLAPTATATSTPTPTPTPTRTPTPTLTPTASASATRIVNVGGSGNYFSDSQSGNGGTTIRVGETVKWVWIGNTHSTTSGSCSGGGGYYDDPSCTGDGQWDSGPTMPPSTFSRSFTTPGTYKYYCTVHGGAMTGTVVVQP